MFSLLTKSGDIGCCVIASESSQINASNGPQQPQRLCTTNKGKQTTNRNKKQWLSRSKTSKHIFREDFLDFIHR